MTVQDLDLIIDNYKAIIEDKNNTLYIGFMSNVPKTLMDKIIDEISFTKLQSGSILLEIFVN